LFVLSLFPGIVTWVQSISPDNVARQIANFHTVFNVSVTILLFPFAVQMVKLITRIIPEKIDADSVEKRLLYLDDRIAQTPAIALSQTLKELNRMGTIACDNIQRSLESFFDLDEPKANKVFEVEKTVDYICHNISNYLVDFRGMDLSEHDLKVMGGLHHVLIDMERISDHAENIAEFAMMLSEKRTRMTPEGQAELQAMSEKTIEILRVTMSAFEKRDQRMLQKVEDLEQEVDNMKRTYINNHISRLQDKACDSQVGVVFTNMVAELERVADHATNIAFSINMD